MTKVSPEAGSSWLIGSTPKCDVVITSPVISGMHCRLTATESGLVLIDLNSKNGTWVNGARLKPYEAEAVTPQHAITLATTVPFPWDRINLSGGNGARGVHSPGAARDSISIGRTQDNDFVINVPIVSSHHARIERRGAQFYIEDTNSRNGTAINGLENRITGPTPIEPSDEIYLGSYRVQAADLLANFGSVNRTTIGEANYQRVAMQGDSMVIGRDPGCDHPLDFPMISWRHAKIARTPNGLLVEDLKSRNGTFVDGKRITGVTEVKPGQEIALGSFRFQLQADGEIAKRYDSGYTIEARNLTFHAKDGTQILAPISFTVYPGELVALMGTSGAGKTTLLKILNGYTPPSNGEVLFNGRSLYEFFDEHSQQIGYVPQDDIVHERLTVREALSYAARLRTPLTEEEIAAKATEVAGSLNLTKTLGKIIGSPENKVLSGGQRKRVNIALELICDTPVLFLDEPTSGLSSADADDVVAILRDLAKVSGKTIITTIHAPSLETFKKFDNVILLSKDVVPEGTPEKPGAMIFYGPAHPGAIQFVSSRFAPSQFATSQTAGKGSADEAPDLSSLGPEHMMKALQQDKDNPDPENSSAVWIGRYQSSRYFKQFVQDRAGKNLAGERKVSTEHRRGLDLRQWIILARRNVTVRFRDLNQVLIMLLQAPIFAVLIWGIFGRMPEPSSSSPRLENLTLLTGVHFLMVVAAVWFGCNNAVRDVVGEWLIYQRERMVCLKIFWYVFSKIFVLNAICMFQCLAMLAIVYPSCNLKSGFGPTLLMLWLASLVGASIGLLISSAPFCKTTESAIAFLPIVLLPMIGLGGGIRPVYKMEPPAIAASYLIPSRWAFEANLVHEADGRKEMYPILDVAGRSNHNLAEGDLAEVSVPKYVNGEDRTDKDDRDGHRHRQPFERSIVALATMFLFCIAGVMICLRMRDVQ